MNRQPCCFIAVLTLVLTVFTACSPAQDAQSLRAPMTSPIATPAGTLPVGPAQSVPTDEPVAAPSAEQATREDAAAPPAADMQSLWAQLRESAGFVVLLRHADTVAGTGDPPGFRLDDCETQRNLSDVGRAQAAQLGDLFRTQGISIRQVLSSQYCRCLETAELMNLGTVEPAPMLNSIFEDRTGEAAQTEQVRQQIFEHRGSTGVMIMVTHSVNIRAISGVSVRPGEAVIVRGTAEGDLEVVGRLY